MFNNFYFSFSIKLLLTLISKLFVTANPLIGEDNVIPTKPDEFPFVVSIGLQVGGREHFCTGSLITRTQVLTAAHCFQKVHRARNVRVLIGTNDLNNGGRKYRLSNVDSWITYDSWAKENNHTKVYAWNDIAIVTLWSAVEEDIPLPIISLKNDTSHYQKTADVVGWGEMKNNYQSNYLHKASLYVMNKTECEDNMQEIGYPTSDVQLNELCTNANPPVLLGCGDSGGPLLINGNEIIGVNEAVCPKGQPKPSRAFNLHTSIDFYRDFISVFTNLTD